MMLVLHYKDYGITTLDERQYRGSLCKFGVGLTLTIIGLVVCFSHTIGGVVCLSCGLAVLIIPMQYLSQNSIPTTPRQKDYYGYTPDTRTAPCRGPELLHRALSQNMDISNTTQTTVTESKDSGDAEPSEKQTFTYLEDETLTAPPSSSLINPSSGPVSPLYSPNSCCSSTASHEPKRAPRLGSQRRLRLQSSDVDLSNSGSLPQRLSCPSTDDDDGGIYQDVVFQDLTDTVDRNDTAMQRYIDRMGSLSIERAPSWSSLYMSTSEDHVEDCSCPTANQSLTFVKAS